MLQLDGEAWSTGAAPVLFGREIGQLGTLLLECQVQGVRVKAFVDTGAEWSVIGGWLAEELEPQFGEPLSQQTLTTRLGRFTGDVHRVETILVATHGTSLSWATSAIVCRDWSGPPFVLGLYRALDRIRFGFDPGSKLAQSPTLHFGEA